VAPVKDTTHTAAFLGTAAHEILERCIKNGVAPETFIGTSVEVFEEETMTFPYIVEVSAEMAANVKVFLDFIGESDLPQWSELGMTHSEIEGLEGTADFVRIDEKNRELIIVDYKNGTAPVQVNNRKGEVNTQLLSYAALAVDNFKDYEFNTVSLTIVQPRAKTKKKVRSETFSIKVVEDHLTAVRQASKLANEATPATLNVIIKDGSHCYYCRARDICPVRTKNELENDFNGGS